MLRGEPSTSVNRSAFMVGEVIPGYCCGSFSEDTMEQQLRVEAVGADWLVLRADNGSIHFYSGEHASLRRDAEWTAHHNQENR